MHTYNLTPGIKGSFDLKVTAETTAQHFDPQLAPVFSTPFLVAIAEGACYKAVQTKLPEGFSTVGTVVNIRHLAPTPVGMKVTAICELVEVDDRRLVFKVEAHDEVKKVAEGSHERFIIDSKKFVAKLNQAAR
ncbi:MAG TPA: thioesterase family protein [Verrucomicrobiae bacterium]|nr:thioesterase family protein [Verrucomicrobiae bacterium]